MKYLIHADDVGAIIEVPTGLSSDGYGVLQQLFVAVFLPGRKIEHPLDKYANMIRLEESDRAGNCYYDWGLAGASGATFQVIWLPSNTRDEVEAAKNKIRRDQDVVHLSVLRITKLVECQRVVNVLAETMRDKPREAVA